MENKIVDYVSQLHVRNAAKEFYSISKKHSQDESINLIFSGMVSFLEGIKIPEPDVLDKYEVKRSLTIEDIENEVCEYYRVNPERLHNKCRKKELVKCRYTIYYLICEFDIAGVVLTAQYYNMDHSTVSVGRDKIRNFYNIEEKTRLDIDNIKYNIKRILSEPD